MKKSVNELSLEKYPICAVETSKNCFDDLNESDRNIWIDGFKSSPYKFNEEDLHAYLSFVEDNYHYHSSSWHDRDTDDYVSRDDMLEAFLKQKT